MRVGIGLPVTTKGTSGERLLAWARRAQAGPGRRTLPPVRDGAVPVFFGGSLGAAIPRIVRCGVGWSVSSRGPTETHDNAEQVRAAWREAGREGSPIIMVMHYFALGEDANVDYLFDYYGYQGDRARMFAEGAYRRTAEVTAAVQDFAAIGVDEYVFVPTMADLSQVDLLADAVSRARV